ncbi:putative zinc finger motif, C2HC5-type-domain-containing protein [Globomyces pollinis-pini]|nr:putative zinc finger motif, C2HC5-type-domain-containing protein [Globomyces pollinis-pini]
MNDLVDQWAINEIQSLTNAYSSQDVEQMVQYAFSLKSHQEINDYFMGILGESTSVHSFIKEFLIKKFPITKKGAWETPKDPKLLLLTLVPEGFGESDCNDMIEHARSLSKKEFHEYFISFLGDGPQTHTFCKLLSIQFKNEKSKIKNITPDNKPELENSKKQTSKAKKKGKNKLDSLPKGKVGNAAPGKDGRPICECLATIHPLITNCLSCGKIICEFEGDESCPFCGDSISPTENGTKISTDTDLIFANERAQTLLDYDRNSSQRTQVHDMVSDFDVGKSDITNKWLTAEQRALALRRVQEIERLEEEQKKRRVVTIDIANNRVFVEAPKKIVLPSEEILEVKKDPIETASTGFFRNPNLKKNPPKFVSQKASGDSKSKKKPKAKSDINMASLKNRLQDEVNFAMTMYTDQVDHEEPDCG